MDFTHFRKLLIPGLPKVLKGCKHQFSKIRKVLLPCFGSITALCFLQQYLLAQETARSSKSVKGMQVPMRYWQHVWLVCDVVRYSIHWQFIHWAVNVHCLTASSASPVVEAQYPVQLSISLYNMAHAWSTLEAMSYVPGSTSVTALLKSHTEGKIDYCPGAV